MIFLVSNMEINFKNPDTEFHNVVDGPFGLQTRSGAVVELHIKDIGMPNPRVLPSTELKILYGFSTESANSGEVFHYLFTKDQYGVLNSWVYDGQFICRGYSSVGVLTADLEPMSVAINYNQIVVNSSSMPYPLWGFIGGTLTKAEKVDSINPDTPALTLFPGRVCSFADRFVWSYANQIIFNDPGTEPRTITGNNAISFGGTVLDIFQAGQGGNLIVVCTDATYTIPPDGLNGYQFQGVISRIPGYQGAIPNNAATSRGTTVGLVKEGVVDIASMQKRSLSSYRTRRYLSSPVDPGASGDYRSGSIIGTDDNFIIRVNNKTCIIDLDSGIATWYYIPQALYNLYINTYDSPNFAFIGALRDSNGKNVYIAERGIIEFMGNTDWLDTPTSLTPTPPSNVNIYASICLKVPSDPQLSPVIREISMYGDRAGFQTVSYVRSSAQSAPSPNQQRAVVIGTNIWDPVNTSGQEILERELRSRRHQRAIRADSPDVELSWTGGNVKIGESFDLVTKGIGKNRPSN